MNRYEVVNNGIFKISDLHGKDSWAPIPIACFTSERCKSEA